VPAQQDQPVSFLEQHLSGGVWRADPPFSSVTFQVRHLGARDYRAGFKEIDATLDVAARTLVATVPVASLDLNNPVIRERMLSNEFLDAGRFPEVRGRSSSRASCRSTGTRMPSRGPAASACRARAC
jgi:polyisoprenoid-binding protein YceI